MKILLVDDDLKHRMAGKEQLSALGHEVVVLSDYFEAVKVAEGGQFDVALLDLLMPAEADKLGEEGLQYLGESIPVGYPLSVKLATLGILYVVVATDTNHHNHPASAIMDWFINKPFTVAGSKVLWIHAPMNGDVKDWKAALLRVTERRRG